MHYRLVDKAPVRCSPHEMYEDRDEDRRIRKTTYWSEKRPVVVSTVFLGTDHNFTGKGPPVLFETMIFVNGGDEWQDRYTSWNDAVAGHERAVLRAVLDYPPDGMTHEAPNG